MVSTCFNFSTEVAPGTWQVAHVHLSLTGRLVKAVKASPGGAGGCGHGIPPGSTSAKKCQLDSELIGANGLMYQAFNEKYIYIYISWYFLVNKNFSNISIVRCTLEVVLSTFDMMLSILDSHLPCLSKHPLYLLHVI